MSYFCSCLVHLRFLMISSVFLMLSFRIPYDFHDCVMVFLLFSVLFLWFPCVCSLTLLVFSCVLYVLLLMLFVVLRFLALVLWCPYAWLCFLSVLDAFLMFFGFHRFLTLSYACQMIFWLVSMCFLLIFLDVCLMFFCWFSSLPYAFLLCSYDCLSFSAFFCLISLRCPYGFSNDSNMDSCVEADERIEDQLIGFLFWDSCTIPVGFL